MIYITGDTHGSYSRIRKFCRRQQSSRQDLMIVLGDTMLNYFQDQRDQQMKEKVSAIPITFLMLHGNHDIRPNESNGYRLMPWMGGQVWIEEQYPDILFAKDGEIYHLDGQPVLTVGGAYSVDKEYRLAHGYHWFSDEQPSAAIKLAAEQNLAEHDHQVAVILTHTCPLRYLPTEALFSSIDQKTVDQSTEQWLDSIEQKVSYQNWYCGHFHIDKTTDKITFVYHDIIPWRIEDDFKCQPKN